MELGRRRSAQTDPWRAHVQRAPRYVCCSRVELGPRQSAQTDPRRAHVQKPPRDVNGTLASNKAPAGCMCNLRVELDPDCHLEGAAARRSKFGCFSIGNHIRNAPFWSGPPDPARQVRIAGSGAGARSPPGIFKRCMLISRFFKFFRGFSSCVQLFRDFSK